VGAIATGAATAQAAPVGPPSPAARPGGHVKSTALAVGAAAALVVGPWLADATTARPQTRGEPAMLAALVGHAEGERGPRRPSGRAGSMGHHEPSQRLGVRSIEDMLERGWGLRFGQPAACPAGVEASRCLLGTLHLGASSYYLGIGGFPAFDDSTEYEARYAEAEVIAFDYWVGAARFKLDVQVFNHDQWQNYTFRLEAPVSGRWERVEVPLSRFKSARTGSLAPGERLSSWSIHVSGEGAAKHPFYVANLKLPGEHVATGPR
jgi:hypothetical protein